MIIVDLFGGMGNQMFQYAAAYRLALAQNTELVLNTYALRHDRLRNFSLSPYWINNQIVDFYLPEASALKKYIYGIPGKIHHFNEKVEFEFDPEIIKLRDHQHLCGYWQNPKYFEDIREVIQSVYSLRSPSSAFLHLQKNIRSGLSVSMHIRRGDFLGKSFVRHKHDVCDVKYYEDAIQHINSLIEADYTLYIFSDDAYWSRQHFSKYNNVHFIQLPSDAEELILMSECRHNIIANSTFSWWAAWLNRHTDKIVIAPEPWLKNSSLPYQHLLPASWIQLKVNL